MFLPLATGFSLSMTTENTTQPAAAPATALGTAAAVVATPPAPAAAGAPPVSTPAPPATETPEQKAAAELAAKPFTDIAQLKLPEGVTADPEAMKEFLPLAGKLGLTTAQAQALVEFSAKTSSAADAARAAAQETTAKAAVEALKADKEIGGANWDKSMAAATKVLAKFGGPELTQAFGSLRLADGTMLGDNLVVAKLLVSIGKSMAEDSVGGTHSNGAKTPANDPGSLYRALYPKSLETLKFP